ncbi:MAG: flagellar biosynthetic protein FliR [Sulfuriflexus sp.]|nr:flagellar biosynthetic protein FliR [Sulfuriflexus sp.]
MIFSSTELLSQLGTLVWPLFRISAIVVAMPLFGSRLLPTRLKVVLIVVLTFAIAPHIPPAGQVEIFSIGGALVATQQVFIGLAMGFALQLVFSVFVLGGQVIALTMGLGFASLNDPITGVSVPTVSQFYTIFVTLLFLAMNGHLIMIEVIAKSFIDLPVAQTGFGSEAIWKLLSWAKYVFSGAVLMALPAMASLLLVNIGFGIMTRAAPQLNIFAIGFPVIMTIGFVILMLSLPSTIPLFENLLDSNYELMRSMLGSR